MHMFRADDLHWALDLLRSCIILVIARYNNCYSAGSDISWTSSHRNSRLLLLIGEEAKC